jgi:hypothetical protein
MDTTNNTVTFPAPRGPQNKSRTRLQDRVPIEAITADARKAKPSRTVQAVVGGFFYMLGWLVAMSLIVLFRSTAWLFSAWKMGWRTARGEPLNQPNLEEVLAENRRLRMELERVT